jgi:hypothetical protein
MPAETVQNSGCCIDVLTRRILNLPTIANKQSYRAALGICPIDRLIEADIFALVKSYLSLRRIFRRLIRSTGRIVMLRSLYNRVNIRPAKTVAPPIDDVPDH